MAKQEKGEKKKAQAQAITSGRKKTSSGAKKKRNAKQVKRLAARTARNEGVPYDRAKRKMSRGELGLAEQRLARLEQELKDRRALRAAQERAEEAIMLGVGG